MSYAACEERFRLPSCGLRTDKLDRRSPHFENGDDFHELRREQCTDIEASVSECGRCLCADPDGSATAPGQRGVDNPVHLRQQHVGSIVLSAGDSNLDGIAQRQNAPPLACVLGRDILAMLPAALGEISKEGLHCVTRWPLTRGR